MAGCCARAASGHAAAAPPRNAMKLRRLMQKPPVEMKPTKGQRCASQQKLAADVADGSNATDRHARDARGMSAMPLCVQPVSATPLVVYRLAFGSPRSFADVD